MGPIAAPLVSPALRRLTLAAALLAMTALAPAACRTTAPDGVATPSSQAEVRRSDPRAARDLVAAADAALVDPGQEEEALRLLAMAIEENPTLTIAHLRMGDVYRDLDQPAQAERAFAQAVTLEPGSFPAQFGHADALHALGRMVEAVRAYLRALAIQPNDASANRGLAGAYLELEEARQALPYAVKAASLGPEDGVTRANLGAVYSLLGRHEEAVYEYEAAAELMELDAALLLNWASSLGVIGRHAEMAITLEEVLRIEPSALAFERLGYANFKLRDYDGAARHFGRAIDLDPTHFPALNGLGVVRLNDFLRSGRADDVARAEAIDLLRRSLDINPHQPKFVQLVREYE